MHCTLYSDKLNELFQIGSFILFYCEGKIWNSTAKNTLEHFAERYLKLDTIFVKCQSQSVNVRHKIEKHGQIQVQDRSEGLLRSFYNVFVIFINCYKFTIRFRLFPKSYWNSLAATKHNRFAASLIHIIWRVRFLIVPDLRGVVLESCPSSHEDKEKKTTKIASARAILHLFTRGVAIKKAETWDLSLVVFYF